MPDDDNNANPAESNDVRPKGSVGDPSDVRAGHAVNLSEFLVVSALRLRSNFSHLVFGNLCSSVALTDSTEADRVSVKDIFKLGAIFQILQSVIRSLSVFVIDLVAVRARANKSGGDQYVNRAGTLFGVFAQANGEVAAVSNSGFADVRFKFSAARANAILGPNATMIRDAVKALIADHWKPIFAFIHSNYFNTKPCILQAI